MAELLTVLEMLLREIATHRVDDCDPPPVQRDHAVRHSDSGVSIGTGGGRRLRSSPVGSLWSTSCDFYEDRLLEVSAPHVLSGKRLECGGRK